MKLFEVVLTVICIRSLETSRIICCPYVTRSWYKTEWDWQQIRNTHQTITTELSKASGLLDP